MRSVLSFLMAMMGMLSLGWAQAPDPSPVSAERGIILPRQVASAPTPALMPYLRVETGMHQAVINRFALLPDGSAVATVSDDKTARLWSVDGLRPLGVVRPPIGPGDDGELVGVAASGNVLALAGRIRYGADRFGVQFYRLPDLALAGQLPTLPAPISALRISRDGRVLVVGMVGGHGLAFFDLRDGGRQVGSDAAYAGQVQWVDVDAQGRAVASGEDGRIRLYGPDHHRITEAALPGGGKAYAVAFSPDGRLVAAGNERGPQVWLLDASTLRPVRSLAGEVGRSGGFAVVAFTSAGDALLGAGTYKASVSAPRLVRRWLLDGGQATDIEAGSDTVMDLAAVGDDLLVADARPALRHLAASGRTLAYQVAHNIDFRDAGIAGFAVSQDGTKIELPLKGTAGEMIFDTHARTLTSFSSSDRLAAPSSRGNGLQASGWRNAPLPRLNSRPVALERDEVALAAAVSVPGRGAAFGTNFYVRFQRTDGTGWHTLAPAPAWAVNISGDGRLVIAGLGDGTVRWYDAATGKDLLTLFVQPDTRHWVLSTSEGFFDHDDAAPGEPDGRTLIGYCFNDPLARMSRFVEVGQLYPVFYRPDLVGLALRYTAAGPRAVSKARETESVAAVLNRGLPASIELQEACGDPGGDAPKTCPATESSDTVNLPQHPGVRLATTANALLVRFRLSNPGGDPGRVAIFRNAAAIAPPVTVIEDDEHARTQQAVIPLGDGENAIRLQPVSSDGQVEGSATGSISFDVWRSAGAPSSGPGTLAAASGRTLFLLSVGISRFSHHELNLGNATNDAQAVATLMGTPDPPIYDASDVSALYDEQATVANITAALRRIAEKAQPDDLVMIFLAGHGEEVGGRYYFAPADFGAQDPELFARALAPGPGGDTALDQLFRQEGLGPDRMLPLIQALKASRVAIVLDTCYSASLATQDTVFQGTVNRTVTNAIGHVTGRFVLSSATALAFDSSGTAGQATLDGEGHGLFTSYLLKALAGRADVVHAGRVDVVQLAEYTVSKVKQATAGLKERQEPAFFFSGNDFFALRTDRVTQQSRP